MKKTTEHFSTIERKCFPISQVPAPYFTPPRESRVVSLAGESLVQTNTKKATHILTHQDVLTDFSTLRPIAAMRQRAVKAEGWDVEYISCV